MSALSGDGFAFVHVPKTGGTWAMQAMKRAGVKYEILGEGDPHPSQDKIEAPFRFGFVRHPATWYASWWAFFHEKVHDYDPPNEFERRTMELSFPDFVNYVTETQPGFMIGLYNRYVGPPDDEIDYIGRYENLVEHLIHALRLADIPFDPEAIIQTPHANVAGERPMITPEQREAIYNAEREVYDRFGYEV